MRQPGVKTREAANRQTNPTRRRQESKVLTIRQMVEQPGAGFRLKSWIAGTGSGCGVQEKIQMVEEQKHEAALTIWLRVNGNELFKCLQGC